VVADVRARWGALPQWARWVLALYLVGFAEGTGDHVLWMSHGGIHAYASSFPPVPVQAFLVGLVVLDPLAVLLAGLARRAGIWLAVGIMAIDMPVNWYWNWSRITGEPGRLLVTAPWSITIFGLFVFATVPALLRVTRHVRFDGRVSVADIANITDIAD
jgi:hypothetical protein